MLNQLCYENHMFPKTVINPNSYRDDLILTESV